LGCFVSAANVADIKAAPMIWLWALERFSRISKILGDKGYRSEPQRLDLFNYAQIRLETPFRCNEKTFKPQFSGFRRVRKRVETVFSQLCHHFRIKENLAKTFRGLAARIATKIAAFAVLQLINNQSGKPLNQIRWAKG